MNTTNSYASQLAPTPRIQMDGTTRKEISSPSVRRKIQAQGQNLFKLTVWQCSCCGYGSIAAQFAFTMRATPNIFSVHLTGNDLSQRKNSQHANHTRTVH